MIHHIRDPYDIWSTELLGRMKSNWTNRNGFARIALPMIGLAEWFFPDLVRSLLHVKLHDFPHVEAMLCLLEEHCDEPMLNYFLAKRINDGGWGLPFGWYSKNGFYGSNTPYVTNTPYVMEAVLLAKSNPEISAKSADLFNGTWGFLESLKVMCYEKNELALSYAPVDEPRIVVNANAYASFAYALHAAHGRNEIREPASRKSLRLARWVVRQQEEDGSWLYYADRDPGNFIDCFHSCFVLKNLLKAGKLNSEIRSEAENAIGRGWKYIRKSFYDNERGLCRRFSVRTQRDPFRWDLYDQAEYLGLLIDFGLIDEAEELAKKVEAKFRKGGDWYCRIDILGRLWGKNFLRWGIVPFWYQRSRLHERIRECAE